MNSLLKEYWHFMTRTYQNAVCVLCMMNTVMFIVVDMELKGRIREAIIKMILDFDIGTVPTEE